MVRVVRVVLSMLFAAALLTAASGTSTAASLLNGVPATIDIAFVNQFGNQFPENDPAFAPLDLTVEQNRQDFEAVVRDSGGSPCHKPESDLEPPSHCWGGRSPAVLQRPSEPF